MAWETTNLLSLIMLDILASGCWAQRTDLLRALEGQTIFVVCPYKPIHHRMVKSWCLKISSYYCTTLVNEFSSLWPRYSIQDSSQHNFFTVTMAALRETDTGFYHCVLSGDDSFIILKTIHLVVMKASTSPTTRSARLTTAGASGTNLVMDSSRDNRTWKFIVAGVTLAVLLLLGLIILVALYFRKVRGRAEKGMNECHHIYEDVAGQKETTGFHQKNLSDVDTGTIHYASLTHLNHLDLPDSIYTNNQPNPKPTPDPLLSVEYARISTKSGLPPKLAALEVEGRN